MAQEDFKTGLKRSIEPGDDKSGKKGPTFSI